jgi:hypothetical protein
MDLSLGHLGRWRDKDPLLCQVGEQSTRKKSTSIQITNNPILKDNELIFDKTQRKRSEPGDGRNYYGYNIGL